MLLAFDIFEIDLAALELRRDGKPVPVEPKVFDVLALLAANRERLVPRDELVDTVWHGRVISDSAVDTCIKAARRAVGDDGKAQRIIRTVPRRGYRFVGAGAVLRPTAGLAASVSGPATGGLDAAGRCNAEAADPGQGLQDQPSIAVLPFEDLNPAEHGCVLAEGLSRDITTRLGRTRWLFVIARGSAAQLRSVAPQEAGARLAVRYVLQGSVQSQARRVRVNVALVDTERDLEIWADMLDRSIDDLFAVQDEIADAIVCAVQSEVDTAERRRALLRPLASLTAWTAYHRGIWHLDRHTPHDYDAAERLLGQAAALDPSAARVFAGLSYLHRQRAFLELTRDREAEVRLARELAEHSLALDAKDPQAHWVMGRALLLRNEVEAGLAEFEAAARLNPSFAMSQYSIGLGRAMIGSSALSDRALATARRLSPVDPIRFAMIATQGFNAAREGRLDRACELLQLAVAQPGAHHHIVAVAAAVHALADRREAAGEYRRRLGALRGDYRRSEFFRAFPFQCPAHRALWARGFALLGIGE